MIEYSKIYYGKYFPRGFGKLHIYDSKPLFLPLRIIGRSMIVMNLHWIPGPLRYKLCLLLKNIYDRTEPKEAFRVTYQLLKNNPALVFTMPAIRRYYLNGLSNLIEIPGENWEDLPLLSNSKYRARYLKQIYAPAGLLK
ncbi:hypothetical protein GW796_05630 [archaeon]|nr:hypothetical protein [archaeon]NCQ51365.1 hypothetical protein [archaeon]NCT58809.1 hypothetical protein [archaeon]